MPKECARCLSSRAVSSGPYDYESMKQLTACMSCPGTCSCNMGARSNFDRISMMHWQQGKPWPFLTGGVTPNFGNPTPPPPCAAVNSPVYNQTCADSASAAGFGKYSNDFCCDPNAVGPDGQCGGYPGGQNCHYQCPGKGWNPKSKSCS
jgi:hypothetical protein